MAEVKNSKGRISETRKHFVDLLKKREEEAKRAKEKPEEEVYEELLKKKRMSKDVPTIFDNLNQNQVNEALEARRKEKEELRRMLSTIKVKWSADGKKVYTRVLFKMIFSRFGEITDIRLEKDRQRCFVQFSNVPQAETAVKHFKDDEDLRVKYLISEGREKQLERLTDSASGFELTSENLEKISGMYNGYSYDARKSQLEREVERQREMRKKIDEELQKP